MDLTLRRAELLTLLVSEDESLWNDFVDSCLVLTVDSGRSIDALARLW